MIAINELRRLVVDCYWPTSPVSITEILDRLEALEKERDFAKVEIARLHDDIRELTDECDTYKAAYNEWIAKTEWVQDELTRGKLPAKYLGMHRADGIRAEIMRLRKEIANIKEVEFPRKMRAVADTWKEKCEKLQAERDALCAKIKQMERQESIGTAFLCVRCSTPFDGDHCCPDCGYHTAKKKTVYALPGAKGEEK